MTTEDALVKRLKQHSHRAFEELVKKYGRRLYMASFRILGNSDDAEDAVQQTFLRVLESINSFRADSSLYTWLYRIVCNESLTQLRKRGQQKVIPVEPYLPSFDQGQHVHDIPDWTTLPDMAMEAEELKEFFEKCVDELPEDYRLPYILKDMEQLSEDQVCQILRLSKPAMKNRVHRARLAIRQRVETRFLK